MSFEERPDTPEQVENVFSSSGRHVGEYTFCKKANLHREVIVLQVLTAKDAKNQHNAAKIAKILVFASWSCRC